MRADPSGSGKKARAPHNGARCFWLSRTTAVVLAILLIVAPVSLVLIPLTDHDAARLVQAAALAAGVLALAAAALRSTVIEPPSTRATVVLCAAGALALASILHADLVRFAALEAGLLLASCLVAILVSAAFGVPAPRAWLVVPVIASLVFSAIVLLRYGAALGTGSALLREHFFPGYSNFRFLNHVQSVTIPLLVGAALAGTPRCALRRWALVALVLEVCWLFFSGGRATLLALAVGAALVLWLFRRRAAVWVIVLAGAAVLGGLLNLLLFELVPAWLQLGRDFFAGDFASRTSAEVGAPRQYLWKLALEYIVESPVLGIGPLHYAARLNSVAAHPHNAYLQIAAEWGLPLAALFLGAALLGFVSLLRAARSVPDDGAANRAADRILGISLLAAFCAIAVDASFSGNLVMPMSQLWIVFAGALAIAYVRQWATPTMHSRRIAPGLFRSALIVLCAASVAAMAWGILPEALDLTAHLQQTRQWAPNPDDNPRIWSHGWVR